jgi:SAM-dependent methyltransferase
MKCPACGSSTRLRQLRLDRALLAECPTCGHLNTLGVTLRLSADDYPADASALSLYERLYLCARRASYSRGLDALGSGLGRRLLDVGSNYGHFLALAEARGWTAIGYEPGARLRASALPQVVDRIFGSRDEIRGAAPFDAITLWDVLEHVEAPGPELRDLAALLDPDGTLLVRVPDARVFAALRRAVWRPLAPIYLKLCHPTNPEEHVSHFTPASLEAFAADAGLRMVACLDAPPDERVAAGRTTFDSMVRRGLHALGRALPYEFTALLRVDEGAARQAQLGGA